MIARLHGKLVEKHPNLAVIDCAGVGYEVIIPVSTYTALPDLDANTSLRIHTHVREDLIQLYGFSTQDEKTLFEKLTSVSGIGPKLAVTVLSGLPAAQLIDTIRAGDVQKLTRVPGIGKKTAERIVLELRDKIGAPGAALPAPGARAIPAVLKTPLEDDVISALLNLGCNQASAEAAVVKALSSGAPREFEPLFRKSLELLR